MSAVAFAGFVYRGGGIPFINIIYMKCYLMKYSIKEIIIRVLLIGG